MKTQTTLLTDKLRFPESPRWHEGKLWCCDFFTQRVVQVDLHGRVETVIELPDTPTSIGWTAEGCLLVVSAFDRRLLRLEETGLVEVADLADLVAFPCNDMVVDGHGCAYIGNMGYDFGDEQATPQPGSILLVTPAGEARIVAEGLGFPNGLAITSDGQTLIVAESHTARLTAFRIAADGSLTDQWVWAQFPDWGDLGAQPDQLTPDGICLDQEGALWVASPNTCEVLRIRQGAEIIHRVPVDTIPLACMLGGPERRTLFIATTTSLNPMESQAMGCIEIIQVEAPGAGLP